MRRKYAILIACLWVFAVVSARAQSLSQTYTDDGAVTVVAAAPPANYSATLTPYSGCIPGAAALGGPVPVAMPFVAGATSTVPLAAPLSLNATVCVVESYILAGPGPAAVPAPASTLSALVTTVARPAAQSATTTTTLTVANTAIASNQTDLLTATVTSTVAGTITGSIRFFDGGTLLAEIPLTPPSTTATYTITVADKLADSTTGTAHSIMAIYIPTGGYAASTSSATTVTVTTATNEREHMDFVGGATFSANGSNYSQGDIFLALNYDRAIYRPGWFSQKDTCFTAVVVHGSSRTGGYPVPCQPNRHPGLNTFFQARLTTIPVNTNATTTTTPAPASGGSTSTSSTSTTVSSFLTAQKTAQFQVGGYIPWLFGKVPAYKVRTDKTDAFFVGPVARFGFSTPSTAPSTATSSPGTGGSGSGTTVTTPTILGSGTPTSGELYNFWLAGFRIGTAHLDPGSIHIVHYFDIGVGKYSNLQSLTCKAGAGLCQSASNYPMNESRTTLLRLDFEGYMELPTTASSSLILGINANYGPGLFPSPLGLDIQNRAKDDLTFLLGYKFDFTKLAAAIPVLGN